MKGLSWQTSAVLLGDTSIIDLSNGIPPPIPPRPTKMNETAHPPSIPARQMNAFPLDTGTVPTDDTPQEPISNGHPADDDNDQTLLIELSPAKAGTCQTNGYIESTAFTCFLDRDSSRHSQSNGTAHTSRHEKKANGLPHRYTLASTPSSVKVTILSRSQGSKDNVHCSSPLFHIVNTVGELRIE